jgi:hypothetical protein
VDLYGVASGIDDQNWKGGRKIVSVFAGGT